MRARTQRRARALSAQSAEKEEKESPDTARVILPPGIGSHSAFLRRGLFSRSAPFVRSNQVILELKKRTENDAASVAIILRSLRFFVFLIFPPSFLYLYLSCLFNRATLTL